MKTEAVVWWFAIACAVLLVLGAFSPRTVRIYDDPGSGPQRRPIATDSAARWHGWVFVAGVVSGAVLMMGRWFRRRVLVAVACACIAAVAFALAAFRIGLQWIALTQESVQPQGYDLYPAPGLPYVAIAAVAGVSLTLVLMVSWTMSCGGSTSGVEPWTAKSIS